MWLTVKLQDMVTYTMTKTNELASETKNKTSNDDENRRGAIDDISEWTAKLPDTVPVLGHESIMSQKENGSCDAPPQMNLRFNVDH